MTNPAPVALSLVRASILAVMCSPAFATTSKQYLWTCEVNSTVIVLVARRAKLIRTGFGHWISSLADGTQRVRRGTKVQIALERKTECELRNCSIKLRQFCPVATRDERAVP